MPIEIYETQNPHRGLDTKYPLDKLGGLEATCSKMILDCVDWDSKQLNYVEVGKMYDVLYQIYCAKLTEEGQEI